MTAPETEQAAKPAEVTTDTGEKTESAPEKTKAVPEKTKTAGVKTKTAGAKTKTVRNEPKTAKEKPAAVAESNRKPLSQAHPVAYMTLVLLALTVVTAFLLSVVNEFTAPVIRANRGDAVDAAMAQVLPGAVSSEALEGVAFSAPAPRSVRVGRDASGQIVGYAVEEGPEGFAAPISMLVGVSPEGVVLGVAIIDMKETPNIGTKTTSDAFLSQFLGKESGFKMGGEPEDVQAISGATISSRAVSSGVTAAIAATLQITQGGGAAG